MKVYVAIYYLTYSFIHSFIYLRFNCFIIYLHNLLLMKLPDKKHRLLYTGGDSFSSQQALLISVSLLVCGHCYIYLQPEAMQCTLFVVFFELAAALFYYCVYVMILLLNLRKAGHAAEIIVKRQCCLYLIKETDIYIYKAHIPCPKCGSCHRATMVIAVKAHCNPLDIYIYIKI